MFNLKKYGIWVNKRESGRWQVIYMYRNIALFKSLPKALFIGGLSLITEKLDFYIIREKGKEVREMRNEVKRLRNGQIQKH